MNPSEIPSPSCFLSFKTAIDSYSLPERFTFPFYYEPHPLSILAARELQDYIQNQTDWKHNFGLDENQGGLVIGKMFGVMVVRNQQNEIGYIAAFSGKLADKNNHPLFVPPIYDMLEEDSFFINGMKELNQINERIEILESNPDYISLTDELQIETTSAERKIEEQKVKMSEAKKARKLLRKKAQEENMDAESLETYMNELV
ncbi:MAG TPA: hypothetical protein VLB74_04715, partial [Flavobacterium sp.]|nr:hypothetical protein [Flavobacterium sp.]